MYCFTKRFLAILLAVTMVLSMAPVYAVAAEEEPQAQLENGNVTLEGNNALGGMVAQELQEKQEETARETEYSGGYVVLDLVVEGNVATVSFDTIEDAQLLVGLYTEDGTKLLASGITAVSAGQRQAAVTITGSVPEYFLARAFLIDNYDYSPLCKSYTTPMYTQQMQELLASTAEDYAQDRVLTLGEDTSTNFVVYHEDTLVIRPAAGVNTMTSADQENRVYVIENADSTVTGMQEGDVFAYEKTATDVLVVKVGSIAVSGTTVTVIGQDVELKDAFAYIKLEQSGEDAQQPASAVEAQDDTEDGVFEKKFELKKDLVDEENGKLTIAADLNVKLDAQAQYYLSWEEIFIKFTMDTEVDITVKASGEVKLTEDLDEWMISLGCINVGFKPVLNLEVSGALSYEITIGNRLGFAYETGAGFQNLCSESPTISKGEWKAEAQISVSFDLCPSIEVLDGYLVSIDFHIPIGFDLWAYMHHNPDYESAPAGNYMVHQCEYCVEVSLYFKLKPTTEITFLGQKGLKLPVHLPTTYKKVLDMYYSTTLDRFDFTKCPNKLYRATVAPEDSKSQPVAGAAVTVLNADGQTAATGTTNQNGVFSTYLFPGKYTFQVQIEGKVYEYTREFTEAGKQVLGPLIDPEHYFFAEKVDPAAFTDHGGIDAQGTDENGVKWMLRESGYMWIYRDDDTKTPMMDYSYYRDQPWDDYRLRITHIVILDGVTHVGDKAFYYHDNLKEITLGADVESVGEYALYDCAKLEKVNLSRNLKTIEQYAFYDCDKIRELRMYENLEAVDQYAFYSCSGLEKVTFSPALQTIGNYAFYYCDKLTEVYLQNNVQTIGEHAFDNCTGLSNLHLSESLTFMGTSAFRKCTALTEVQLPNSPLTIDGYAFYQCTGLKEITIPEKILSVGGAAFGNIGGLEKIFFNAIKAEDGDEDAGPFINSGVDTAGISVVIGPEVTVVPSCTFYVGFYRYGDRSPKVTSVTFAPGSKCESIGSSAFGEIPELKQIQLPEGLKTIEGFAFMECAGLESVILPETLESIGSDAFARCTALKQIRIPDAVTEAGYNVFSGCTALEQVYVGTGLSTINSSTFKDCAALKQLQLSEGLVTIEYDAFRNCVALTEVTIPDTVTTLGTSAFRDCTALHTLTLGDGLQTISGNVFQGCTALKTLDLGEGVQTIAGYAFGDCTALTEVTIPDSVTKLNDNAFCDNTALVSVHLGKSLKTLGTKAFGGCSNIQTLEVAKDNTTFSSSGNCVIKKSTKELVLGCGNSVIPTDGSVKTVGSNAFYQCTALKQIHIPDSVTKINTYAFYGCSGLEQVTIGTGACTIENNAFQNCTSLKELDLGGTTAVGRYAFSGCTGLVALTLSDAVKTVDSYGFEDCTGLTEVTFGKGMTTLNSSAFIDCVALKKLTLNEGLQTLGSSAFKNCTALEVLVLPASLKTVGSSCFYGCTGLTTVDFGSGLEKLESNAFYNCTKLEAVQLPDSLTSLGTYAFQNCTGLQSVKLGSGVNTVGSYTFQNCTSLKELDLGGVTKIDGSAFQSCAALETVALPDGLQTIGNYAFESCSGLKRVDIPDSVTSVGSYAFRYCSALTDVTIGSGVTSLNSYAFRYDSQLTSVTFKGNAPTIGSYCFGGVTATVYYPAGNTTWTSSKMTAYGGTLNWTAYDPETGISQGGSSSGASRSLVMAVHTGTQESEVVHNVAPMSVYPGEQESETSATKTIRTATFEDLVPGQEYLMLALASMDQELIDRKALLNADNLLYVYQAAADENGVLTVQYEQRVTTGLSYIMACGASHQDISNALVEFPLMGASEQEQAVDPTVVYEGLELVEGEDYIVAGTTDYTAAGDYTCYIRGIYDYSGLIQCEYTVHQELLYVTGISLNQETLTLKTEDTATLIATVTPNNATDQTVFWTSGDETVATVDTTGKVTALKIGTAVVTATTKDGGYRANCLVSVECNHSYQEESFPATAEKDAYTTYLCGKCGDTYEEVQENTILSVAQVGEVYYTDLQEALNAAEEGSNTVILKKDLQLESYLTVPEGVLLDLNGKDLSTTKNLIAYGTIQDGPVGGEGTLSANQLDLLGNGGFLPIYDTLAQAYRLYDYTAKSMGTKLAGDTVVKFGMRLTLTNPEGYRLLATTENSKLTLRTPVTWDSLGYTINYSFKAETLRAYAQAAAELVEAGKPMTLALTLTVFGTDKLPDGCRIYVTPSFASETALIAECTQIVWANQRN